MIDVYREFPGEYRVNPQPDIALLHEKHIYGPGESVTGTDIPIGFRVGDAPQWIGYFRGGGSGSPRALSAVFTLPHPTTALVVADGFGYMIDVQHPDNHLGVDLYQPIEGALTIAELPGVLLFSQSYMAAIDGNGVVWLSVELAEYEYVVDEVSEGRIRGRVEPKHENRPFELDFETGVVVAGTEFLPQELRRLGWRSQD